MNASKILCFISSYTYFDLSVSIFSAREILISLVASISFDITFFILHILYHYNFLFFSYYFLLRQFCLSYYYMYVTMIILSSFGIPKYIVCCFHNCIFFG